MHQGFLVGVFPEGERTPDGRLGPFLGGAFAIAKRADMPIRPMVLTGAYDLLPRYSCYMQFNANLTLTVLDPIPVEVVRENSTEELSALVRNIMIEALPPEARPVPEEETREN